MSFLFDKTIQQAAVPPSDVVGLRGTFGSGLQGAASDLFSGRIDPLVLERIIGPVRDLFTQSRGQAVAQAKESAGSLTGSGLGLEIGGAVNRSLVEENAIIANLINQERDRLMRTILGFSTAGLGQPQIYQQPGLLSNLIDLGKGGFELYSAGKAAL